MDGQWRLKKRLLHPPRAPQRKQRLAVSTAKRAVLQLDDDPWMERVRPIEGSTAPLTVFAHGKERVAPTFQPITHDAEAKEEAVQEPSTAPVATMVAQSAAEESQGLNLMPPEGSLASPRASSEVGELDAEEELNAEEELCTEEELDTAFEIEEAHDTPEEMGHDE